MYTPITKRNFYQEINLTSSKSKGPGGQKVNKVNTKVELRFNISKSLLLSESEKEKIKNRLKNRINKKGEIVISCQTERSQARNKQLVIKKFHDLLAESLKERKKRIPTKPGKKVKIKRLELKRRIAEKKKWRKKDFQY